MGDQGAPVQEFDDVTDDVGEGGLVLQHLGGQSVDVCGPGVHAGIQQADHRVFDPALRVEREGGEADDAGVTGPEARGLDIDDDPAIPRFGGWSAPGVAHTVRMARTSDSTR